MEPAPAPAPPVAPLLWVGVRVWSCRWGRRLGRLALGLGVLATGAWGVLALTFADTHAGPRWAGPALFVLTASAALGFVRPWPRGLALFGALFTAVLLWFACLRPSNDRDWAPEFAQLGWVDLDGDWARVHRVRHFDYRSARDFTPHWEDRRYDLRQIRSVDLMLSYWGSAALAHAMVSFGFADGRQLVVSVESRRERGEAYSPLQGAFRQYEKIFIFADERDVVRLRTAFRGEAVYLYRTTATPTQARRIFESYAAAANALKSQPVFYNSLTGNCASAIVTRVRAADLPAKITWETVLSGYAARYMYAQGSVDTRLPFAELEARSRINAAADAAGDGADFSTRIRAGLPNPARE